MYAKLKIKIYHTQQAYMLIIYLIRKSMLKQLSSSVKLQELSNKYFSNLYKLTQLQQEMAYKYICILG